jgi:fumarylacetoacetase
MQLSSLIDVPAHHHFSIHNLPYGVFSPVASSQRRIGVALGDKVTSLALLRCCSQLRSYEVENYLGLLFNRCDCAITQGLGENCERSR